MTKVIHLSLCALALSAGGAAADEGEERTLRLATTTSTDNSGLIKHLLPPFEKICDCRVLAVAVGSGKALAFGRAGDVDALLTHAPEAEKRFVADGFGVARRPVMHNDFVIVGPPADPANIASKPSAAAMMQSLAERDAPFVSRGDDSGTHRKERELWQLAGKSPNGEFYIEAGAGMGRTLLMADELNAYTLSDRGTFLAFRGRIRGRALSPPSVAMRNPYSVIVVHPSRHPHAKTALAEQFADWLQSPAAQKLIADFRLFGEPLFFPANLSP